MNAVKHQNIIGPLVQELRERKGLSRAEFAEELKTVGWDISVNHVEKIEMREAMVKDFETLYLFALLKSVRTNFGANSLQTCPRIPSPALQGNRSRYD
ncbi:MAG: helix-turn-helix transcriptional regulator, partial [Verrucomicrobiota bacterium]|nr:helix-turn-helix transcriptional regulator [Verrucomicrobiota bacterium]